MIAPPFRVPSPATQTSKPCHTSEPQDRPSAALPLCLCQWVSSAWDSHYLVSIWQACFFYFPRPSSGVSTLGSLSPLEQVNVIISSSRVPWDSTQMHYYTGTTVFQYFVCTPVQLLKGRDHVIFIFVPSPCQTKCLVQSECSSKTLSNEFNVSG